jgi:hypothetical protein
MISGSMDTPSANKSHPEPLRIAFAAIWVLVILVVGAPLCAWAIDAKGWFASVLLWPLGWLGGAVAHKILGGKSKVVGGLLVAACVVIFLFAEVAWIHWNWALATSADDKNLGTETWFEAVALVPTLIDRSTLTVAVAGLFCAFGAISAYRQVAVRYRIIRVIEE